MKKHSEITRSGLSRLKARTGRIIWLVTHKSLWENRPGYYRSMFLQMQKEGLFAKTTLWFDANMKLLMEAADRLLKEVRK